MRIYAKIVTYVYLALVVIILPFFAPQGYENIGDYKYYLFRGTGVVCFGLLVPVMLFYLVKAYRQRKPLQLSVTDKAMLLYAVAVVAAFLCSEWKDEALWGTEGWYMGAVTQLMFVAAYFAVSRFAEKEKMWYVIFLVVSFCVFLLGLLNRFSVYPFRMEGANPGFISTLGNINWFCSYWVVVFPVGLVLYWLGTGETIWKKAALIIYIIVGFMTGIVQGSSSGFLALGIMFLALFCLSFRENEKLLRWMELLFFFVISALLISVMKSWFPDSLNYHDAIAEKLTEYSGIVPALSVLVVCYAIVHYRMNRKGLKVKNLMFLRNTVIGIVLVAALALGILIIFYTKNPEAANSQTAQAFVVDSDWGNSRGTTWAAGITAFHTMSFREKLTGIGPDCFSKYVYGEWDIAVMLYNVFGDARLTNAHNEWLTVLVNVGICGFLTYVTVFVTAVYRQLKADKSRETALVSAVCVIAYTIHNMVSFQQVIGTPIVFILMGMGEGILCRNMEEIQEKN